MSKQGPSRREVVAALSALSMWAACGGPASTEPTLDNMVRGPEPEPWDAPGSRDLDAFGFGVQTTDASPSGVLVSCRSREDALTYVLMRQQGDGWEEVERSESLTPSDQVTQVELDGLDSDTAYSIVFYAPDGERRSSVARFRTAMAPGENRVVTIGVTSCLGSANAEWPSLLQAADDQLDAMILLGDTVYADGSSTIEAYRWHWERALSTRSFRKLSCSTSMLATWDDHEVDNDWDWENPVTASRVPLALQAFREALPHRPCDGDGEFWRKLAWGDTVEFFVLDGRTERREGRFMSEAQTTWLLEGLKSSRATFKVLLNAVPIADMSPMFGTGEAVAGDKWYGFVEERRALIDAIAEAGVTGVISLGGDIHMGFVGRWDPEGESGHSFWEVTAGPAGSFLNPLGDLLVESDQFPLGLSSWNWARLTLDPFKGEVLVEFVGDDGLVFKEIVLRP